MDEIPAIANRLLPEPSEILDGSWEAALTSMPAEPAEKSVVDLTKVALAIPPDMEDDWFTPSASEHVSYANGVARILQAADLDGRRLDIKIPDLSKWTFGPDAFVDHDKVFAAIATTTDDPAMFVLRWSGFRHLCERIKAPAEYLCRLPGKLSMACVNYGLDHDTRGPALLRLAGNQIRGILSARYAPLDDPFVLKTVEGVLHAAGLLDGAYVRSIATGLTTVMRISFPAEAITLPTGFDGDIIEIGLDLTNGEVGNRAVGAVPIAWRRHNQTCARYSTEGTRLPHIGDPERLAAEFTEALPRLIEGARSLRGKIQVAVDRVLRDLPGEFDALRSFGLSASEARETVRLFMDDRNLPALPVDTAEWPEILNGVPDPRAFDVFAAITRAAIANDEGKARGVDRRLSIEESAGKYLASRTK